MLKYTKEKLEFVVGISFCINDVLRNLNLKLAGGNHSYIKSVIKKHNIDTSHFVKNIKTNGNTNKKHWTSDYC